MAHLEVAGSVSSSAESVEDVDLCSDSEAYEIPPPTYVAPLSPPKKDGRSSVETTTPTQLHLEIEQFSKMLEMDREEIKRKKELIQVVTDSSWRLFKNEYRDLKVQPFGGFTNGLGTRRSDVDIVLTGIISPDGHMGGFGEESKRKVSRFLNLLYKDLNLRIKKRLLIRDARIPVLKLQTEDGIDLDISIGNHGGPRAAAFIKSKLEEFPVARAIILVVKYMLKKKGLNEVAQAGLGTYALANMVIAYVADRQQRRQNIGQHGSVLLGFLKFYGDEFNIDRQAVSLKKGTFCRKADVEGQFEMTPRGRFCIEDAITGNDVSGGTAKVYEIRRLFSSVYYKLRRVKDDPPVQQKKKTTMFPLLSPFIDSQTSAGFPPVSETEDELTYRDLSRTKRRSRPRETSRERDGAVRPRFETPSREDSRRVAVLERPRRQLHEKREWPPGFDTIPFRPPPPPPGPMPTISQLFATVFVPPSTRTDGST